MFQILLQKWTERPLKPLVCQKNEENQRKIVEVREGQNQNSKFWKFWKKFIKYKIFLQMWLFG